MARAPAGRFCWVDLAAADATRAAGFYTDLFGWSAHPQAANGGEFVRLAHAGRDIGSLYQMRAAEREAGVASHWTPYVQVDDVAAASRRAALLGASVAVKPFLVEGMACIALIVDPDGAELGLWGEPPCK